MLKISIVLITTTAFAALLIVYPFSPRQTASASATVATATQAKPTVQPDPLPQNVATTQPSVAASPEVPLNINGKTLPLNIDGMSTALARLDAILDAIQTPDSRLPPRPAQQPRQDVQTAAAPVTYPQADLAARPTQARPNLAPGPGHRHPTYTNGTPSYGPPSGPLRQRANVPNTAAPQPHHVNRNPSVATR